MNISTRNRRIPALAMAAVLLAALHGGCAFGENGYPEDSQYIPGTEAATAGDQSMTYAEFGGHRYEVFASDGLSWEEIRDVCERRGGCLATINSWRENEFLYNLCMEKGFGSALFGYYLDTDTGRWEWLSGEPVDYINWHEGEPNNSTGVEFYGMFYHGFEDGAWNDGDQEDIEAYICEWN